MTHDRLQYLLEQWLNASSTASEEQELKDALAESEHDAGIREVLYRSIDRSRELENSAGWEQSAEEIIKIDKQYVRRISWLKYAAAIVLLIGMGTFLWFNTQKKTSTIVAEEPAAKETAILPGRNGAILRLGDGTELVLDSLNNGIIEKQKGVLLKDGQLIYNSTGEGVLNTTTTPNGRQFNLTLSDGTRVWLNAASSITYPAIFNGTSRRVSITGEVYFEVAKDKLKPFAVDVSDKASIEVLGTSFNVKAYEEEDAIKATLLEGSVRVNANKKSAILKPGQQVQIGLHENIKLLSEADLPQVMAWKNGLFNFNGYDVRSVMREIGRWYNLEIQYESEPEPRIFRGKMQRNLSLDQLMLALKSQNIHCRIDGRKLIITR
jgi:transmembrane sensor